VRHLQQALASRRERHAKSAAQGMSEGHGRRVEVGTQRRQCRLTCGGLSLIPGRATSASLESMVLLPNQFWVQVKVWPGLLRCPKAVHARLPAKCAALWALVIK